MQGSQLDRAIFDKHWKLSGAELSGAIDGMESAAAAFAAARDRALAAQLSSAKGKRVNAALLQVERQLTRPQYRGHRSALQCGSASVADGNRIATDKLRCSSRKPFCLRPGHCDACNRQEIE
jgi:hypothetical protein